MVSVYENIYIVGGKYYCTPLNCHLNSFNKPKIYILIGKITMLLNVVRFSSKLGVVRIYRNLCNILPIFGLKNILVQNFFRI